MKKLNPLLLILALVLLCTVLLPGRAEAAEEVASGTCGDIYYDMSWTLTDDGTLTISGSGRMINYRTAHAPWYDYKDTIRSVVVEPGVTALGACAFSDCVNLSSVTLPEGLDSLGDHSTFSGCTSLTSIEIPEGVTNIPSEAFQNCVKLTDITLPSTVDWIGSNTFAGCTALESITLPESITEIFNFAFSHCTSLRSIRIPSGITEISESTFEYCTKLETVEIPDGCTTIGVRAFYRCSSLRSITIPDSVTFLNDSAFSYCTGLERVNFGTGLEQIDSEAFSDCESLTHVVLPENLKVLGDCAFDYCSSLETVTIPAGITSIGKYAIDVGEFGTHSIIHLFYGGTKSQWDEVEVAPTSGNWAQQHVLTSEDLKTEDGQTRYYCSRCIGYPGDESESGVIARGVCGENLTWVLTDDGTMTITGTGDMSDHLAVGVEQSWNEYLEQIHHVVIKPGVTSIGYGAFYGNDYIETVEIPATVTQIDTGAFYECGRLERVCIEDIGAWCAVTFDSFSASPTYYTSAQLYLDGEPLTHLVIPEGVERIPDYAFRGCETITQVTFPSSLTAIGQEAFQGCTGLTQLSLPDSVTELGEGAFQMCYALTEVALPSSLTVIPREAFYCCSDLSELIIPEGVTEIGYDAVSGCTSMTLLAIPDTVTQIGWLGTREYSEPVHVLYQGSKEQWDTITIAETWDAISTADFLPLLDSPILTCEDLTAVDGMECYVCPECGENFPSPYAKGYTPPSPPPPDPEHPANPFADVDEGAYYYDSVMWAVESGVTAGTSATRFSPGNTCTRGQVVTFLWRANGSPEPESSDNPFTDVKPTDYYYKAVLWAVERGITSGTSATRFSPANPCTRGQVATFLWRAKGSPEPSTGTNPFSDVKTSDYFCKAVLWAVENGVTAGVGDGRFAPTSPCTRGQIVTFLYRALG